MYPMYDYAHSLSDAIEGITHSLCTLEFEDHRPLYDWCVDRVDLVNHPELLRPLTDEVLELALTAAARWWGGRRSRSSSAG